MATHRARISPALGLPDNLPAEVSTFIGREREVEQVLALLANSRVVTLVGSGGVGKSRLALRIASVVRSLYRDGVRLIELAPLSDPDRVPHAVAEVIQVRGQPDCSLEATLTGFLAHKRMLLVFDNCEHVLATSAHLVAALLRGCPGIQVLATSREPLGVAGEHEWRVPSLAVPDPGRPIQPEQATRFPAVQLLVERARAIRPEFCLESTTVHEAVELCNRLDGIPLAIELAAARLRVLSLKEIVARLDNRFRLLSNADRTALPRHLTLAATLRWSYDLLDPGEQAFFRMLSVFSGSFSLEAAEAVSTAPGTAAPNTVELLGRLAAKSLVNVEDHGSMSRYRLLETVRQYAAERLTTTGTAGWARQRHAEYFLSLAERGEVQLWGPCVVDWLSALSLDQDNFRAALQVSVDGSNVDTALRLAGALYRFWLIRGSLVEGRQWFERVLALPGADAPSVGRAKVVTGVAGLALMQVDLMAALTAAQQAAHLWSDLGDEGRRAYALVLVGRCIIQERRGYDSDTRGVCARTVWEEALRCAQRGQDRAVESMALTNLGAQTADLSVSYLFRDPGEDAGPQNRAAAVGFLQDGLKAATAAGYSKMTLRALSYLSQLNYAAGDLVTARQQAEDALAVVRATGDAPELSESLILVGWVATAQRDFDAARRVLAEAVECAVRGTQRGRGEWELVECGRPVARLAASSGQVERALQVYGALLAHWTGRVKQLPPHAQERLDRGVEIIAQRLEPQALEDGLAAGRRMSLKHALLKAVSDEPELEPVQRDRPGALTPREVEVVRLMAEGQSNRQIAEALVIAVPTAERHVATILRKLQVRSRGQAAVWAVQHGIASGPANERHP